MLNQLNSTTKRELDNKYLTEASIESLEEDVTNLSNRVNTYLTTEQKVGRFGDDDLYQITIDCGLLWSSMNKAVTTTITVDKIISIDGVAISSTEIIPIPYNGRQVNDGAISLYITKGADNVITINITTFSDRTSYTGYVTLQYTKPAPASEPTQP